MRFFGGKTLVATAAISFMLIAGSASATTLLNGDFSSFGGEPEYLPSDFDVESSGSSVAGNGSGRVSVENRGGDEYLELMSPAQSLDIPINVTVSQTVNIMEGSSIFSFDIGIENPDPSTGGGSNLIFGGPTGFNYIGFNRNNFILQNGATTPVTVTELIDDLFDWNVTVDLSRFEGEDVELTFLLQEDDDPNATGTTTYLLDNLEFLQNPGSVDVVPLPAPILFLISGMLSIGWIKRKRA